MYTVYSVLMSVYFKENPRFLRQSIESMLNQTVKTNDFVLICDGPLTQNLNSIIDEFEKKYPEIFNIIRLEKNQGLGHSLNIGIINCKNELIARMDSDDISLLNRCQQQIYIFNQMPDIDIVSGYIEEFENLPSDTDIIKKVPETNNEIKEYSKIRSPFNHPCVMYKKNAVIRAGNYREFYHMEDYDLWIRMLIDGCKGYNIQNVLLQMRAGSGMYRRRGSLKYLASISRFEYNLVCINYIKWNTFLFAWTSHAIVCFLPNSIRKLFYRTFLRD